MAENLIELDRVSKRYRLGEHLGPATDLRETIMARLTGKHADVQELWALKDITLSIEQGEVLGIIGRNGAGKSTFLKVVGGVTTPTTGRSRTRGRIGSLLEVGTGFNDELTGRENTFLSGAILGMGRHEVQRQLDAIVEFAGLSTFMDTPVKRYSSGMYLRLAFAVAAHLEADILLVDEVLAVGDADFRRKCLAKMSEVGAAGRTVLFASHNLDALSQLCTEVLWFDHGRIVAQGSAAETVRSYLDSSRTFNRVAELDPGEHEGEPAVLRSIVVRGDNQSADSAILAGEPVTVELEVEVVEAPPEIDLAIVVERDRGPVILDENMASRDQGLGKPGHHRVCLELPPILTPGDYTVGIWLGTAYDEIAFHERILGFTIEGDDPDKSDRLIDLQAPWSTEWIGP